MADLNTASEDRTNPLEVQAYEFGQFRIDIKARRLLRDGDVIPLTSKAFETLLILVTHRNRAVTKDELMHAVWPNTFVSDDSLTQAIASVRRVLGDAECVATIPRHGYRFIVPVSEIPPSELVPLTTSQSEESKSQTASGLLPDRPDGEDEAVRSAIHRAPRWTALKWTTVMLSGLAAGAILGRMSAGRAEPGPGPTSLRFTQEAPLGTRIVSGGMLSPDGRHLAFVANDEQSGLSRLWVRPLDSVEPLVLEGTENAERLFWSPDSQSLGFVANGTLKTLSLTGDRPRNLASIRSFAAGASWGPNLILFSNWRAGLDAVAPWGGATSPTTSLDASRSELQHRWPHFLPDGRHYLFSIASTDASRAGIYIGMTGSLDRTRLLDGSHEIAVYARPGYLLYVRDGTLMAQRFDVERLRLEGAPAMIADNISPPNIRNTSTLSATQHLLAYTSGASPRRFTWFDRTGKRLSTIQTPCALHSPAFSSDEKRLLAQSFDSSYSGIWLLDLERDVPNRIVPDGSMPMWSPDGETVAFGSYRGAPVFDLYLRRFTGKNEDEPLLHTDESKFVNDWTRDGRYIVFASSNATTGEDVWLLPTFGSRRPIPYLRTEFNEIQSRVSPDGRWIAYTSNESGNWEVYVQSFPAPGAKQVISVRGGAEPVWRRDGRELYYLAADRT
ncbi:MAG: winged helix-turn-helix domain-containing protein, partial [Vicinamibacterales bacterium]